MRKIWSAKEIETVRKLYPNVPTSLIAFGLHRSVGKIYQTASRLGLHKSAEYMASADAYILRRNPGLGARYRFKPGQVPPNKGLRRPGYAPGRMAQTQFKSGERSEFWKPVGTIVADPEGYLRIKVRERVNGLPAGLHKDIWPLVHWRVWEQHHGPVPKGHKVVFRDRDRSHCEIENLECISDAEMMRRNSVHNLPAELVQVIMLNGALKRKIRRLCGEK